MKISNNLISHSNTIEQKNTYNLDNFDWITPFYDKTINFTLRASETVEKLSFTAEGYIRDNGTPMPNGYQATVTLYQEGVQHDFLIGRSEFTVMYTVSDNVLTITWESLTVDSQETDQVIFYNIALSTSRLASTSIELKENECFIQNSVLVNGNINNTGIISTTNLVLPPLRMIKVQPTSPSGYYKYRFAFSEPFHNKNYACYYVEFGDIDSSNDTPTNISEQKLALEGDLITSKPGRFIIPLRYISLDDFTLS